MTLNRATLIGNLGRDPEMRYTQGGAAVANFSIATTERWTDRNTNEKREATEWHRLVAFGRTAEIVGEYLSKGSKVYVEGRLQTRKWQGNDGQDRYTTEIVVRDLKMLDSRGGGGQQQGGGYQGNGGGGRAPQGQQQQRRQAPPAQDEDEFDDIPF